MADVAAAASAQKRKFEEETTEAPAASEQASSKRPRSDEAIVSAGECAQVDANQMHARNIYRKAPPVSRGHLTKGGCVRSQAHESPGNHAHTACLLMMCRF